MRDLSPTLHTLWDDFPTMQRDLHQVIEIIHDSLNTDFEDVQVSIDEMMTTGGKLLRPALTILMGRFFNHHHNDLLHLAATVEMLHTATLIHDDIIDDAAIRRHHPAIQAKFGKDVAVYAGDYLFAVTFKTLAFHSRDLETGRQATLYLESVLNGELKQRDHYYQTTMTIDDYKDQIAGKTAALFELAAQLGLSTIDDPAKPADFNEHAIGFAHNLGMAFQILDDILEYEDNADALGKPTLNDMREGIYAAPLLYAMQLAPEVNDLLAKGADMTDTEAQTVAKLVHTSGAQDEAKTLALAYTEAATDALDRLPDSNAKDMLYDLSEQLLQRQN